MMNDFDFSLPAQYLKPALFVSLLSVWVLIGLFYSLNRYTRRVYFTIWTTAWIFYALWLTLCIALPSHNESPLFSMFKHWCIGASAVFMVWGSTRFLQLKTSARLFGLFLGFLCVWSYVADFHLSSSFWVSLPLFGLISLASEITAWCFYRLRRSTPFTGSGLLAFGFFLWGAYLASYPYWQSSEQLISCAFFISAVLQLFIAVSMIVLVLEEIRLNNHVPLERHESETALLRSRVDSTEERYKTLFDQASESIIIASASDLKILEINHAAERLLGISATEAKAESFGSFCQNLTAKSGSELFEAICQKREISIVKRDGSVTLTEVTGAPIAFELRPAYQFFLRELTERARLEQQVHQAEKFSAIGRMISGVAHELNNPIGVIQGFVELILERPGIPSDLRSELEKVAHESNRAAKLVKNFLKLARENPSNHQPVDLNELIDRVLDLGKFELRRSGTELLLDLDGHLPLTYADPDQIQQVLVNLINNAVQAMLDSPRPGQLTIRSEHESGTIRIHVQDNGPGIPSQALGHIYEPFFTTKPVGRGTGLGLSIAHSIMAEHRGKIFHQPVQGGGVVFVIEIPALPENANQHQPTLPNPAKAPAPMAPSVVDPSEILILDDEESVVELLGKKLRMLGHAATLCSSPQRALEILYSRTFDLVLSDFKMPEMNGREFYEMACKIHPELATRFIFLTGDMGSEETQDFLANSGNPHIPKPFNLSKVQELVGEMLQADKRQIH